MGKNQTAISVSDDTFDELSALKRDGETWNGFMKRTILSETHDGDGTVNTVTLDDGSIDDIANVVSKRTADEVESVMSGTNFR